MKQWITVSAILLTVGGAANAVITFSEFPVGTVISNQYAPQGVIFLAGNQVANLPIIWMDGAMPTAPILSPQPPYAGDFSMQFTAPAVNGVTFISGFWNAVGAGVIKVYDPSMGLLATLSNTSTGVEAFNITGLGQIGYVYFNSVSDPAGADIDNLAFSQVPTPGALLLGSLGAALVGWMRRRRAL